MNDTDRFQNDQPAKKRRKSPWLLYVVLAVIGIISTGTIWKSNGEATVLQTELNRLKNANEQLNLQLEDVTAQEAKFAAAQENSKLCQLQLKEIYRQYRDIEDFAPNPSNFIIIPQMDHPDTDRNMGLTRFSIPEGKHTLKIDISKITRSTQKVVDQQKMSYDLPGNAAYILKFDHDAFDYKTPVQLKFLLTSNAAGFKSISENIFEPIVRIAGGGGGGHGYVVMFPNQFQLRSDHMRSDPRTLEEQIDDKGLRLPILKLFINPTDEAPFDIKCDIRIVSEGPIVVDERTIRMAMLVEERMFGPIEDLKGYRLNYLQDGMYEVIKSSNE